MRLGKRFYGVLLCLMFLGVLAVGQVATPTSNVITRIVMVESRYYRGSTFSIDVDGREYWITAKHILTGAKNPPWGSVTDKSVSLKMLNPKADEGENWLTTNFSVIDTGKDIDIVVLAPQHPLLQNPLPSLPTNSEGVLFGGDCEFLGFPYGGSWRARFNDRSLSWMPFVKHCGVSAMTVAEGPKIWVLDGINNEGFSGGPVIFRTGSEQKLFAAVSGYRLEPAEIVSAAAEKEQSAKKSKQQEPPESHLRANVNSGFIIAYDISYAIDAIHGTPIGPLRPAK